VPVELAAGEKVGEGELVERWAPQVGVPLVLGDFGDEL
jgi:hypothetical protein